MQLFRRVQASRYCRAHGSPSRYFSLTMLSAGNGLHSRVEHRQVNEAAGKTLAGGAAIGTLLGAGLGALIGSTSGQAGAGAAIGAASGLLAGTALATDPAYAAASAVQRRYDNAYLQCMYAKGNQIPGMVRPSTRRTYPPPPPPPPGFTPGPPVPPRTGPYPPSPPPDAR